MYTMHNDIVVRTLDKNDEPIQGASVEVIARPPNHIPDVRKKKEDVASQDYPKYEYDDERDQHIPGEYLCNSLIINLAMPNYVVKSLYEATMANFSDEDHGYGDDSGAVESSLRGQSEEDEMFGNSQSKSTNELGQVTFPRRPVGAKLLIRVKARPGYYSNHSSFFVCIEKLMHIFFSYKDATKVIKIEKDKSGTTTTTIVMEYVDTKLRVSIVDIVNDNPLSGIMVSVDGPNRQLESITDDRGIAEFKNVGYTPVMITVKAKSRG